MSREIKDLMAAEKDFEALFKSLPESEKDRLIKLFIKHFMQYYNRRVSMIMAVLGSRKHINTCDQAEKSLSWANDWYLKAVVKNSSIDNTAHTLAFALAEYFVMFEFVLTEPWDPNDRIKYSGFQYELLQSNKALITGWTVVPIQIPKILHS